MMNTANTQNNGLTFAQLNDTQKQRLVDKFLDVHPLRLNNNLVEYVLQKSLEDSDAPFSYDDITNHDYYGNVDLSSGNYDLTEEERDEKLSELEDIRDELEQNEDYEELEQWENVTNDIQELEDMDFYQTPEIYQWFSCSDWLIRELDSMGECTLDGEFWGRQCCGQSVALDHVMQQIAFNWFVDYNSESLTLDQIVELGL
jgi:hypothetical protein